MQVVEGRQTVVICGFGELGQTIANMLEVWAAITWSPLIVQLPQT